MTDRTETTRAPPRSGREWTVFVAREATASPRHVGSVRGESVAVAREHAAALFDHAAATLWLCPADELRRFSERDLGEEYRERDGPNDDERVEDEVEEDDEVEDRDTGDGDEPVDDGDPTAGSEEGDGGEPA